MSGSFIDDLRDIPGLNDMSSKPRDRGLRVTGEDADGDFDGEDDLTEAKERETFPCESCQGTGRYRGVRIHQPAVECFACKGKGYFFKSYKDRLASRQKRAARKQRVIQSGIEAFAQQYPTTYAGIVKHAAWNEFMRNLLTDLQAGKELREGAIAAADRVIEKANARDAERDAAKAKREEGAAVVNAAKLKEAFDAAARNGLKRPVLRYDGFQVSRAPDHGKNAGALYVKHTNGAYLGKILNGKFLPTQDGLGYVVNVVAAMNDPLTSAIAYGKRTGNCSCCGRKLTDKHSVANGIGPICADKYGWMPEIAPAGSAEDVAAVFPQEAQTQAHTTERGSKYDYPEGMTADEKRKFRAAARKEARK